MVSGGLTQIEDGHFRLTDSVEIFDFKSAKWRFGRSLPRPVTGSSLIEVDQRPALVGRYGSRLQRKILRYTTDKYWTPLPVELSHGRSDFLLLTDVSKVVRVMPNMASKLTKYNPGDCGTEGWRSVFGIIEHGKKAIFRTNRQMNPWIQLDLGQE